MPTYEYLCQECDNKFEIKLSISEKEKSSQVTCPQCGSKKTIQLLGNFFTVSKGNPRPPSGCVPSGGCCGPM